MKIDILTIFPEMFSGPMTESILKRAQEKGLIEIKVHNLRDWSSDKHHKVDAPPYGGGAGMVLKVDVIDAAVEDLRSRYRGEKIRVILMDTKGQVYNQKKAKELTQYDHLIMISGHYEGVDHRVHEHVVDEVISIGEYVLTGGELPAMIVADSVLRLIPGVLGSEESLLEESYEEKGKIEYPQYTRPEDYKGWRVPEILLSGHHKKISDWRKDK